MRVVGRRAVMVVVIGIYMVRWIDCVGAAAGVEAGTDSVPCRRSKPFGSSTSAVCSSPAAGAAGVLDTLGWAGVAGRRWQY
jgi:hypothetical protein